LDNTIFNKARWISVIYESIKQMRLWFAGFLTCEKNLVRERGTKFICSSFHLLNDRYSIKIRNGEKLLPSLLMNIDHGLTQCDSLNPLGRQVFLDDVDDILNSVNSIVDLPNGMAQQTERLKEHVKKKR